MRRWNPSKADTPEWLRASRMLAGEGRRGDVYAGVDVFARDRPRLSYGYVLLLLLVVVSLLCCHALIDWRDFGTIHMSMHYVH